MNAVYESLITATSWMLLHSLWQFGLVFLLYYLVLRIIPEHWPQFRYLAGLFALAVMILWAGSTFTQNYHPVLAVIPESVPEITNRESVPQAELIAAPESKEIQPTKISFLESVRSRLDQYIHWLFAGWLFFFIIHFVRFILGLLKIRQLNNSSQTNPRLTQLLQQVKARLSISREIKVKVCHRIDSPWVTGVIAPLILMPFNVATGMTSQQIEQILLHELIHIRHQDFLVNLVQSLIGTIFFFNPFVFWLNESIRFERECRCDQLSLKYTAAQPYRHTLLKVMQGNVTGELLPVGILGRPHTLFNRFKRMQYPNSTREKFWIYFILVGFVFTFSIWTLQGKDSASTNHLITQSDKSIPMYTPDQNVPAQDPDPEQNHAEIPGQTKDIPVNSEDEVITVAQSKMEHPELAIRINGELVDPEKGFAATIIKTISLSPGQTYISQFKKYNSFSIYLARGNRPIDLVESDHPENINWNLSAEMIRPGDRLVIKLGDQKIRFSQDNQVLPGQGHIFSLPIIKAAQEHLDEKPDSDLQDQIKVYINDREIDPAVGFPRATIDNISFALDRDAGKASDYRTEVFLARGSRPIDKIASDNLEKIEWNLPIDDIRAGDRLVIRMTPKQTTESDITISIPVISPDDANNQARDSIYDKGAKSNPFRLVGGPSRQNLKTTRKLKPAEMKIKLGTSLDNASINHEDMNGGETQGHYNGKARNFDLSSIKKDTDSKQIKPQDAQKNKSSIGVIINNEMVNLKEGYSFNDFSPVRSIRIQYNEQNILKKAKSEPITVTCYLEQGAKALESDDSPGFEKIIKAINNRNYLDNQGIRLVFEMKNTTTPHVISVPLIETSPAWIKIGQKKYSSGEIKIDTTFDHLYFGISEQVYELLKGEKLYVEMFFDFKNGKKGDAVITMQVLEDMKEGFYVQFGATVTQVLVGQRIALVGGTPEDLKQLHIDISALKPGVNQDLLNLSIELPGEDE